MRTEEVAGLDAPTPITPDAEAPLPFEEALRQLDDIVEMLESGNVPLEQSIALARRGLDLAEYCDTVVSQAEATLEQLVATTDGELVTRRLNYDADDDKDEDDKDEDDKEDVTAHKHE